MNFPDEKYVYHGSKELFKIAAPKRQIRSRINENGNQKIIFNDVSFHATPYKWIALAYTCDPKQFKIDGKETHYNIGVDLYDYSEELQIFGFKSLQESLEKLYGGGGYLFLFKKERFFHIEGLGNLEVITKEPIKPVRIERIDNPVLELEKLGISFKFIDLRLSENEKWR